MIESTGAKFMGSATHVSKIFCSIEQDEDETSRDLESFSQSFLARDILHSFRTVEVWLGYLINILVPVLVLF